MQIPRENQSPYQNTLSMIGRLILSSRSSRDLDRIQEREIASNLVPWICSTGPVLYLYCTILRASKDD